MSAGQPRSRWRGLVLVCETCRVAFPCDRRAQRFCSPACAIVARELRNPWPARFWAKTRKADNGCIEWIGAFHPSGYGRVKPPWMGNSTWAHRVAFRLAHGRDADPMLDHICRNRACVNASHLRECTAKENAANGAKALQTHCLRGHPLWGPNLRIELRGYGGLMVRRCRACRKAQSSGQPTGRCFVCGRRAPVVAVANPISGTTHLLCTQGVDGRYTSSCYASRYDPTQPWPLSGPSGIDTQTKLL